MMHPDTGMHYVHVVPDHLVFWDVRQCYTAAAKRVKWMSVITIKQYQQLQKNKRSYYWRDRRYAYILWTNWSGCVDLPASRKAKVVMHYSEMIGPTDRLFDAQRRHMDKLFADADKYDAVFAHTRFGAQFLKRSIEHVYFAPIGYDVIMGQPRYDVKKLYDIVFYGTCPLDQYDKRTSILPVLRQKLKCKLHLPTAYGTSRTKLLNKSYLLLDIPHADGCSFGTMRLWQTIASSAVLLVEPMDTWPGIPNEHYIQLPVVNLQTIDSVAEFIDETIRRNDLQQIAKHAHKELSRFTPERCMQEFVIPNISL